MKVFFDGMIYSWQKEGGIHRYSEELINECGKNKEMETTLLIRLPSYYISPKKGVVIKNIAYFRYVPDFLFSIFRKIFSPINKILFENYFRKISAGIFHSTYYTTYKNLRIPQVLTIYDMIYERFPYCSSSRGAKRFIANKKKCIMNADAIICISNVTKRTLTDIYKVDDKKISVIHLGISEDFILDTIPNIKLSDISDKPYFLFVGFRKLYKNFIFFIEAFSKWNKNKNYNILVAGGSELTEEERLSLKKFGIEKQVKLLGFVDEKDLRYMYKNSTAFVYPSLEEGFGLPILEAIGSRGEVIASDIDAFREIGENMVRYFNPRKIESLINALEQSTSERHNNEELERRAKYVINKYSWKECVNKTIEVYKKVQKNKK